MKKIASILSALLLVNNLATAGFAFEGNETVNLDSYTEYETTDDTTLLNNDFLEFNDVYTMSEEAIDSNSAVNVPGSFTVYQDNPHISQDVMDASKALRDDGRYIGWSLANINTTVGGPGYDPEKYGQWSCSCGVMSYNDLRHLCNESGSYQNASGYAFVANGVAIHDEGVNANAGYIAGPMLFSGYAPNPGGIDNVYISFSWLSWCYVSNGWSVVNGQEQAMIENPLSTPWLYYDGDYYFYYDEDGMVNTENPTSGWVNLYLGERPYVVYFSSDNNNNEMLSRVVLGEGNTIDRPIDPLQEGKIFAGWYADEELTTLYDFDTIITSDLTIYAKYEEPKTVAMHDENGFFIDDIIIADGRFIIQDSIYGVIEHEISEDVVNVYLETPVSYQSKYVSGWVFESDNGNVYAKPQYSDKTAVNLLNDSDDIVGVAYVIPNKTIMLLGDDDSLMIVGTETTSMTVGDAPEILDGKYFTGWDYYDDSDGNVTVYPIYRESIFIDVHGTSGEFLLKFKLLVGDEFIIHDYAGNVIDTFVITSDMTRFDLTEPAFVDGKHHTGWEIYEDGGNVYVTPVYCPYEEDGSGYKGSHTFYPTSGSISYATPNGSSDGSGSFTASFGSGVYIYDHNDNLIGETTITGSHLNGTLILPDLENGYGYKSYVDEFGNVFLTQVKVSGTGGSDTVLPDGGGGGSDSPDGSGSGSPDDFDSSGDFSSSGDFDTSGYGDEDYINPSLSQPCVTCGTGDGDGDIYVYDQNGNFIGTIDVIDGGNIYVQDQSGVNLQRLVLDGSSVNLPEIYADGIIEGWYTIVDEDGNVVFKPIITSPTMNETDLNDEVVPDNSHSIDPNSEEILKNDDDEVSEDDDSDNAVSTIVPQTNDTNFFVGWFVMLTTSVLAYFVTNRKKSN